MIVKNLMWLACIKVKMLNIFYGFV